MVMQGVNSRQVVIIRQWVDNWKEVKLDVKQPSFKNGKSRLPSKTKQVYITIHEKQVYTAKSTPENINNEYLFGTYFKAQFP